MSSKRSVSVCSRSPKFYCENQNSHLLFSSTCSNSSQISKSPFETVSQDDIQGSSALLAAELDKQILVNASLNKEIGTWKRKYKDCYRLIEQHIPQGTAIKETEGNGEYKEKYENLKLKASALKKGFKALEGVIADKDQEIVAWEEKYGQMEQEYIDQIQNLRNQIEVVLKSQIEKEVTLAFSHFEKEKAARQEDWEALVAKLNQSQIELRFMREEKEQVLKRVEEMRGKLEVAEGKSFGLERVNREYKTLSEEHEKTLRQLEVMREQLSAKEMSCQSIESKCTEMSGEIEKLRETVKEKTTKCVLAQIELNSLGDEKRTVCKELEEMKEQLKDVEKNYRDAQCKYMLKSEEVERLRAGEEERDVRVGRLHEGLAAVNRERERVVEQLEDVKAELMVSKDSNKELEGKVEVLKSEAEEKSKRMVEIEKEVELLREEKKKVEKGLEEMKLQVLVKEEANEYRRKALEALNKSEMESFKGELKTAKEMVQSKERIVSSLEEEIKVKEKQISVKEGEVKAYEEKVMRQQEEMKRLQENVAVLSQEVVLGKATQALNSGELRRKDDVLESVKSGFRDEVERLKGRIAEYEESLETVKREKSDLKGRLEKIERESVESLKNSDRSIEEYEKRVQVLIEKNGLLMEESGELRRQVEKLGAEKEVNEQLRIELVKNEIVFKDLMRILGVDGEKIVGKVEEVMKEVVRLGQESSGLKEMIEKEKSVAVETRVLLEKRVKELESDLGKLKVSLEEEGVVEMVKKIGGYQREMKRMGCEAAVLKKRFEDQEMKNIKEIDRVRSEAESVWKKRMEAEVESKKLVMIANEEYEVEIKSLTEKNEKLNARVSELTEEIEKMRLSFEEEKVMDSRLSGVKFELEKERRVQQEKEFASMESQLKEKVSLYEGQARNWKAKVEDFELRQVMYFIEIERLYAINGELIEDVNRLTLELKESSMELEKNRRLVVETTRMESARNQQRDQFEGVAQDLTKQVEALERKFESHMKGREQENDVETPVKKMESFGERRRRSGYGSIQKSHAELRELAMKFESEKKTMESQLVQLKKIVDMNKTEMKRINQENTELKNVGESLLQEFNNQKSPSIRFGEEYSMGLDQPRQSFYENVDVRPRSPFGSQSGLLLYNQFTSSGKENVRSVPRLSLTKSGSQSALGLRNNGLQRDEDSSVYPKVSVFKY